MLSFLFEQRNRFVREPKNFVCFSVNFPAVSGGATAKRQSNNVARLHAARNRFVARFCGERSDTGQKVSDRILKAS
jgi:hypothetical protein